ncbi:MAG: N-acetyl-gamma-glutamyl-phosphate reductase [Parvularculaceae bacterium]
MTGQLSLGLIGVRGFVGREVLRLVAGHPTLKLVFASSRDLAGQPVSTLASKAGDLTIEALTPQPAAKRKADIIVLGLPNGLAAPFVAALEEHCPNSLIIDLSADYRFTNGWAYGLPELYADKQALASTRRIANPGCYATMAQLAIFPALEKIGLGQPPSIFAVSGYSGAGTTPGPMNDLDNLADNLIPYQLTGHLHEQEIAYHLGHEVRFTPHVHPAFSGLLVSVHLRFKTQISRDQLIDLYREIYRSHDLIQVQDAPPTLKDSIGQPGAILGGFEMTQDGYGAVIVSVGDNLLKGAAVQAVQNINIASGFAPLLGLLGLAGSNS